jgi:hypothetical protein
VLPGAALMFDGLPGHVAGMPVKCLSMCRPVLPGCHVCREAGSPVPGGVLQTVGDTWESPICGYATGPGTSIAGVKVFLNLVENSFTI